MRKLKPKEEKCDFSKATLVGVAKHDPSQAYWFPLVLSLLHTPSPGSLPVTCLWVNCRLLICSHLTV